MTSDLIGVRAAAQLLGVHENTVRNWTSAGIIETAQITVAGYRKYSRADVEVLRARLYDDRRLRVLKPLALSGPLCQGWAPGPGRICMHSSCWSIAAELIYLNVKQRRG